MAVDTWSAQIPDGWKLFKVCTCGGVLKHKYRNATLQRELHILPTRGRFRVFSGNKQIAEGVIGELKTKLETL